MLVSKPNGVHTAVIRPMSLTRYIAPVQYWEIFRRMKTLWQRRIKWIQEAWLLAKKLLGSTFDIGHPRDRSKYLHLIKYYRNLCQQCAPASQSKPSSLGILWPTWSERTQWRTCPSRRLPPTLPTPATPGSGSPTRATPTAGDYQSLSRRSEEMIHRQHQQDPED